MFTLSVCYWWNSVSLNRSLAFISTMSFSEDLLCLCGYFFPFGDLPFTVKFFWVAWRELSVKMIDTETAFAPCLCVGSFPSVHSCVPLSVPAAHGTNKSVTAACEKSRLAVCMCVTRGNVAPHSSNETTEAPIFEACGAAGIEPCVTLWPQYGRKLVHFDTPTQLKQRNLHLPHMPTTHKCLTCSICQTHTMLSSCQVVVNVWEWLGYSVINKFL